jgi:uncharacterized protein (DUF302 family)
MRAHYGFGCRVALAFPDAIQVATAVLKQEGFGVLTEIDVKATLKAKLGVDYQPYVILGACNPHLAYRGLQAEPELGLLLPCNVIVYDNGDGTSTVSIVDPLQMLGMVNNPALQSIADEANVRLRRVVDHLAQPALAPV